MYARSVKCFILIDKCVATLYGFILNAIQFKKTMNHLHISFISEHTVLVHIPTELYEYCIISLSTISYY